MGRRAIVTVLAVPAGLVLVLGAEVLVAINGPDLPARDPLELSGLVGKLSDRDPLRIAWLGDSVAAGVGASDVDAALPRMVAAGLGRPVELHVFAVSSERVGGALAEQVPRLEALPAPPDVVVVEIGANDVTHLTSRDEFRTTYELLLERVGRVGAEHVLALGIPAFGTSPRFLQPLRAIVGWRGRRLDEEVRAAAAAHGARYVDIAGRTAAPFGEDPARYYAADEFHPSDAGYELWARAVLDALAGLGVS